jgi:Mg-chelatase subunit ChlI
LSDERILFPFDAVVDQDDAKLALLLNAVDPRIGGVLLRGHKGTAKSTLARGLAALLDRPFIELPLGATEDRVIGSIDVGAALGGGEVRLLPGLLAAADGGVLYVDEVNLLADHLVDALLDVAASGVNRIEREGVSHEHDSRFVLIGSMNPEEGELRPQLLDRFGLCVDVEGIRDLDQRVSIVEKRADWEDDPTRFYQQHAESEQDVRSHIAEAIATFPEVELPREILRLIAQLSIALEVDGHRSDLVCARAAQAKAAYDTKGGVGPSQVGEVAEMVFAHRVHSVPFGKGGPNLSEVIARMIGQT